MGRMSERFMDRLMHVNMNTISVGKLYVNIYREKIGGVYEE